MRKLSTLTAAAALLAGVGLSTPANADNWQIGDVFAAIAGGQYNVFQNNGIPVETITDGLGGFTTGCAFNNDRSLLYTTNFSNTMVPVYSAIHAHAIAPVINTSAQSPGGDSESVAFYADGSFTVGHPDGNDALQQYDNTNTFVTSFFPDVSGGRGVDWHDPAVDQDTVFYTSESRTVRRFDIGINAQGALFAALAADGGVAFALRLLPPGDGTGGLLVADTGNIKRLNGAGAVSQTYDVGGEDNWFSLSLDPNGTSFWAGDSTTGNFYRFAIAGGVELGPIVSGATPGNFTGLCVLGEPAAAVVAFVDIDVKAFSDPNGFNCKKKGVLPVTIWGTATFDVSDIDLTTVVLKLADGTPVGGPVVNSLICDRGDPDDTGSSEGTLIADCFDAETGMPGQDGVADKEGGTPDGFDDIDVRFDAQTVIGFICTGRSKRDIIPDDGLVIMGELNNGLMFTSLPVPDVGIDQLLVSQVPKL